MTAAALALAAHALPAFWMALPALLLTVAGIWSLALRYAVPRAASHWSPRTAVIIDVGLGVALIVAGVTIFASIADEIGPGEQLVRLDQVFSDAIGGSISSATRMAFATVTHLGDPLTRLALGIAVATALILRGERWLALCLLFATGGNGILNLALKFVFERARPLHDHGPALAQGWSFPSGHSSGSVVLYGMLAYIAIRLFPAAWHLPAVLVATAIAFSVGCSRVFIQAHFASDVVAGFASGAAWLTLCIGGIELLRYRRRNKG
jgi:membrane-associated phospholipid phosphatase